jgi:uncharacterized membrane protein YbaN (DUF454 family)
MDDTPQRRSHFRWAWWLLAYVALGLGLVGIVVPGLPTVPFILLSAWAAAQGSTRLHRWLLAHPRFGRMIHDWHAHGAVARRSKWMASGAMVASALLIVALAWLTGYARWWAVALPIACMAVVAAWLWRRPEPPVA